VAVELIVLEISVGDAYAHVSQGHRMQPLIAVGAGPIKKKKYLIQNIISFDLKNVVLIFTHSQFDENKIPVFSSSYSHYSFQSKLFNNGTIL